VVTCPSETVPTLVRNIMKVFGTCIIETTGASRGV
jgi:hypothetical protein